MKFAVSLLLLGFLSVASAQFLPFLSDQELRQLLRSDEDSEDAVRCILEFYDDDCDPRLRRAYEVAPDIFRNGGKCTNDCSEQDQLVMKKFLRGMQRRHPDYYRKLIQGLTKQTGAPAPLPQN